MANRAVASGQAEMLPRRTAEAASKSSSNRRWAEPPSAEAGGRRESNGVKKRVPVVEDEPGLCLALQDWLEGEGCKVNMDRSRFKRAEDDSLRL